MTALGVRSGDPRKICHTLLFMEPSYAFREHRFVARIIPEHFQTCPASSQSGHTVQQFRPMPLILTKVERIQTLDVIVHLADNGPRKPFEGLHDGGHAAIHSPSGGTCEEAVSSLRCSVELFRITCRPDSDRICIVPRVDNGSVDSPQWLKRFIVEQWPNGDAPEETRQVPAWPINASELEVYG